MPRLRIRFSLLTALLLTTIVGLAIVVMMQWRDLMPLRSENLRLRAETGQLTIEDPKKAYAIAIPTFDHDTWRWRVYLPSGREYTLNDSSGHLPAKSGRLGDWCQAVRASGVGTTSSSGLPAEFILEARIYKDGDQWILATQARYHRSPVSGTSGGRTSIWQPNGDWLSDRRGRISSSSVSATEQKAFGPDEPILLLHMMRPVIKDLPGGGHTSSSPTGPADGFAIWLEPAPPDRPGAGTPSSDDAVNSE